LNTKKGKKPKAMGGRAKDCLISKGYQARGQIAEEKENLIHSALGGGVTLVSSDGTE